MLGTNVPELSKNNNNNNNNKTERERAGEKKRENDSCWNVLE